jgi:hypothetical protein
MAEGYSMMVTRRAIRKRRLHRGEGSRINLGRAMCRIVVVFLTSSISVAGQLRDVFPITPVEPLQSA